MPMELAKRYGQLNVPTINAGKAPSTAQAEANMGTIGEKTMQMVEQAGNSLAKAAAYMQRQRETQLAQDALTEYLAGRQKLDTVRDALSLDAAVAFEDDYYTQTQKLHAEFLNKINGLKYSDIREKARGEVNNTNIMGAAKAENFFFGQKEKVAKNKTNALIDLETREVVNNLSSNPGMEDFNVQNIANGYEFVYDQMETFYAHRGYKKGSPEMSIAMQAAKDKYFASVLKEASHLPDEGVHLAHSLGKIFKSQMTPAKYNETMHEISAANLSEELAKDPSKFFEKGDVNGKINFQAAADESDALRDDERRRFLESYRKGVNSGETSANSADRTYKSMVYMAEQDRLLKSILGFENGIWNDTSDLKEDEKIKISRHLQKNISAAKLVDIMFAWDKASTDLTSDDARTLLKKQNDLIALLTADPELGTRSLQASWFNGRRPSVEEVMYACIITNHMKGQKEEYERTDQYNVNLGGLMTALKGAYNVLHHANNFVDEDAPLGANARSEFDSLPPSLRDKLFNAVSEGIVRFSSQEYANRFKSIPMNNTIEIYKNDIFGSEEIEYPGKSFLDNTPFNPMNLVPNLVNDLKYVYYIGKNGPETQIGMRSNIYGGSSLDTILYSKFSPTYNKKTNKKEMSLYDEKNNKIEQFKETLDY